MNKILSTIVIIALLIISHTTLFKFQEKQYQRLIIQSGFGGYNQFLDFQLKTNEQVAMEFFTEKQQEFLKEFENQQSQSQQNPPVIVPK